MSGRIGGGYEGVGAFSKPVAEGVGWGDGRGVDSGT